MEPFLVTGFASNQLCGYYLVNKQNTHALEQTILGQYIYQGIQWRHHLSGYVLAYVLQIMYDSFTTRLWAYYNGIVNAIVTFPVESLLLTFITWEEIMLMYADHFIMDGHLEWVSAQAVVNSEPPVLYKEQADHLYRDTSTTPGVFTFL